MGKGRKEDPRVETDPLAGGLTHNPFAALGGTSRPSPAAEPTPSAGPTPGAEPTDGRVVASRERRGHGGKTVVRVTGLADPAARAREAGPALGTRARVDGADLIVQGDQLDRVIAWFEARGTRVTRGTA